MAEPGKISTSGDDSDDEYKKWLKHFWDEMLNAASQSHKPSDAVQQARSLDNPSLDDTQMTPQRLVRFKEQFDDVRFKSIAATVQHEADVIYQSRGGHLTEREFREAFNATEQRRAQQGFETIQIGKPFNGANMPRLVPDWSPPNITPLGTPGMPTIPQGKQR